MITIPPPGSVRERISREEWNLGFILQSADDIVRNGITKRVLWMPEQSPWHGLADPGCFTMADGRLVIFAERINWLTGRGEIWSAIVALGMDPTQATFEPWARATHHLSYPSPLLIDGQLHLTMETSEGGFLSLWRQHESGRWIERVLMDRPVIDPTLWHDDNGWWLFCTFADDQPDENLHLFFADNLYGPWTAHRANPVKMDRASARPAGPLFLSEGRLIRPSQDSSVTYGGAIVLNAITRLDRTGFAEQPVRRLAPMEHYPHGLHTFCPAGDITIIDGKRWSISPLDVVRYPLTGVMNHVRKARSSYKPVHFESGATP